MQEFEKATKARPVLCQETAVVYSSAAEASKQLGISAKHISQVCQGKMLTASGYHWRYVELASSKPRFRVYCVEKDKMYLGATDAARDCGVGAYAIMQCVMGKTPDAGGYHWSYISQDEEGNDVIECLEDKTWTIYKHTNKVNGKSYIGQTRQNVHNRWRGGYGYVTAPKFWSAIVQYGWDNFTHEILEAHITSQAEANQREKYWIDYYNTCANGYNYCGGAR